MEISPRNTSRIVYLIPSESNRPYPRNLYPSIHIYLSYPRPRRVFPSALLVDSVRLHLYSNIIPGLQKTGSTLQCPWGIIYNADGARKISIKMLKRARLTRSLCFGEWIVTRQSNTERVGDFASRRIRRNPGRGCRLKLPKHCVEEERGLKVDEVRERKELWSS